MFHSKCTWQTGVQSNKCGLHQCIALKVPTHTGKNKTSSKQQKLTTTEVFIAAEDICRSWVLNVVVTTFVTPTSVVPPTYTWHLLETVNMAQNSVFDWPVQPSVGGSCSWPLTLVKGSRHAKPNFCLTFTGQVGTPMPLQHILHLPLHLPQVCSQAPRWKHLSSCLWRSQIWIVPSPRDTMHHDGSGLNFLWTPQSGLMS